MDMDYFDREKTDDISSGNPDYQVTSGHGINDGDEQPFGAIVLRPGINVQLRVGYSNDPNMLEVLINGRVVDLSWNSNGDLCNIVVQSFGTELTQKIKGTNGTDHSENWDDRTFYSTHQLLGAMMLQSEVAHFGRWEYGVLRQIGEDKNADLDFYPYSKEGYQGCLLYTSPSPRARG